MIDEEKQYEAILVDTSIYDGNGLRLEKGLLGKLSQFKRSPIEFLMPDVIRNEIKKHLEERIRHARNALEKALNDAGDHLFFEGSELNDAKKKLIEGKEIEGLSDSRLSQFIDSSGAIVLKTGDFVSVGELLEKYFNCSAPFAETGKKKNEFPDAIVLMAAEAWAKEKNIDVLAVAKDGDWESYCESSNYIDYEVDFSKALVYFNKENAPYALVNSLEVALSEGKAQSFISNISELLHATFDGFTPDQEADSDFYWEPDGCHGWFKEFSFIEREFQIIDKDDNWVVLKASVNIKVGAEGNFSLKFYDSVDKDYMPIGSVTAEAEEEFESPLLITISGDFEGSVEDFTIEEVEVVDPIGSIHFGTLEPDFGD
jgi:hypothetical protein